MKSIEFTVLGVPAPKGSSRAMLAGGKAVNVPFGSKANELAQLSWGNAVRTAAVAAVAAVPFVSGVVFGEVPLRLTIVFRMRRRKSDFKKDGSLKPDIPKYHQVKPDLSKLIRATEDSLIGIIMLDDSQVSELLVRKIYIAPGGEGAWIKIEQLEDK